MRNHRNCSLVIMAQIEKMGNLVDVKKKGMDEECPKQRSFSKSNGTFSAEAESNELIGNTLTSPKSAIHHHFSPFAFSSSLTLLREPANVTSLLPNDLRNSPAILILSRKCLSEHCPVPRPPRHRHVWRIPSRHTLAPTQAPVVLVSSGPVRSVLTVFSSLEERSLHPPPTIGRELRRSSRSLPFV
jgi:hypothetical protein